MTRKILICGGGARGRVLGDASALFIDDAVLMDRGAADSACKVLGLAPASVEVVVIPVAFDEIRSSEHIEGMAESRWKTLAEDPLLRLRVALQLSSVYVKAPGGAVVLVVPEIAVLGVAGLAAQSMATEGARTLAKTAARMWVARGITVNSIAVSPAQVRGEKDGVARPPLEDIGKLTLTIAQGRAATGNTIFADGGEMVSI
jgi:hypothetical protein